MRKGFEVNGDYRLMDSSELVYILTNSAVMVNKVQEKEVVYGEECSFEDVLAKMTPGKRNLVMAGVELYKRCNSNKNQRPVIRQSTDIYDYMQPVLGDNKTEECWAILMNSYCLKRLFFARLPHLSFLTTIRAETKNRVQRMIS